MKMEAHPIHKKLKITADQAGIVLNCPAELDVLWEGISLDRQPHPNNTPYDFVLAFAASIAEFEALQPTLDGLGKFDCIFWIAYPKKSGAIPSDLHRDFFWTAFNSLNLRPVTQISIDDTWSALRFRPSEKVGKTS